VLEIDYIMSFNFCFHARSIRR